MAVEDRSGDLLGWYLCCLQRDGTSEVVQIGAVDGAMDRVLGRAISDAWRGGSAMVQGRLEPALLEAALVNRCWLRPAPWTVVHTREPRILEAMDADDVFLSALENEQPW
jgi:hypothetical protein